MAARTTGKPKQAVSEGAAVKRPRAGAKAAAGRSKTPARKTSAAKKAPAKAARPKTSNADKAGLLAEQNEALRAELEQANARIKQLEELNKNVVDRIDWVIDSLQSVLAAKR